MGNHMYFIHLSSLTHAASLPLSFCLWIVHTLDSKSVKCICRSREADRSLRFVAIGIFNLIVFRKAAAFKVKEK